ncbi:MAG: hypothetical protein ABIO91_01680 [Pyrinomonadaceae bacterium]
MQFLRLEIGSPNTAFLEKGPLITVPFRFPYPTNYAFALIQGFDLQFQAADNELEQLTIIPTVNFGTGDRSGTVQLRLAFIGDEITWPWNDNPNNTITAHIRLLVIGTDTKPNSDIII